MFPLDSQDRASRHSARWERGEGKFKAILVTLIIAAGFYAAFKTVPAYVNNYQLKDKMQEIARYAVVTRENEDQIRDQVYKEIDDLRIPVKREEIKVAASPKRVTIDVDYKVPVDLQVYQTELHFTDNADNASLF